MSRAYGDELLKLIKYFPPSSPELLLPKSSKSVTCAIGAQTKYNNCDMKTIRFLSHLEMDKWESKMFFVQKKMLSEFVIHWN